jgi:tetratricopeptide (TPR) repeat protein
VITLLGLIAAAWYFNKVVVPTIPAMFEPTPTPTRSPESFVNEAENLYKSGKLKQAIDQYKQAILANPKNPAIYIAMARVMVFNGQYEDARKAAEDALILNPDNSMAYAVKGWALNYLGDYLEQRSGQQSTGDRFEQCAGVCLHRRILLDRGYPEDLETAIARSLRPRNWPPTSWKRCACGYAVESGNFEDAITGIQSGDGAQ